MSYCTVAEFRVWMDQAPAGAATDAKIQQALDEATKIIDGELGFAFAGYASAAATRNFSGGGGNYLHLPYHESGSLSSTSVKPVYSDLSVGSYYEHWEADWKDHTYLFRAEGWPRQRYQASAKWGYPSTIPDQVVRLCFEIAVNLYVSSQSAQFTDIVGVEGGGAVGYQRGLTNRQKMIIQAVRLEYGDVGFS